MPAMVMWATATIAISIPGFADLALVLVLACILFLLPVYVTLPAVRAVLVRVLTVCGVTCAAIVLVLVRVASLEPSRAPEVLLDADADHHQISVTGVATGFIQHLDSSAVSRAWVTADLELGQRGTPVVLWLNEDPGMVVPGTRLTVAGSVRPLEPSNRSAFAIDVTDLEIRTAHHLPGVWGEQVVGPLRTGITEVAAGIEGAELVPGFAVGDTSLVDSRLDRLMKESSLTHLVAVSGANCALVISAAVVIAKRLFVGRRGRILLAGGMLVAFVTIVGPDASVERAAIMATVTLVSAYGGKRQFAMPSLALAMMIMLIANPWQAMQAGFALSVAATAGILWFTPSLRSWLVRSARLPVWIALPLAVTLAAQLTCVPFLLLLEPGLPVGGVLANLIAVPVAPFGTGIGLIAMLIIPLSPQIGALIVWIAAFASSWVIATAEVVSVLPFARWHWPEGALGAVLFTALACLVGFGLALRRGIWGLPGGQRVRPRRPWHKKPYIPRTVKRIANAMIIGGVVTFLLITTTPPIVRWLTTPKDWIMVVCDVGQGDAILLRSPDNRDEVMLIDTGDDTVLLSACLDRFGVNRITALILTHDDRDHTGALDVVVDRTDSAIIAQPVTGSRGPRDVESLLEQHRVPVRIGVAGMSGHIGDTLTWEILAPADNDIIANTNAASLILAVDIAGVRVLLLGDSGAAEHRQMVARGSNLEADIVKIAHHGSADQDPGVLRSSGARFGFISVGADNRFGHPHPDTLSHLQQLRIRTFRTDFHGAIAVRMIQDQAHVWTEKTGNTRHPGPSE